MEPSGCLDVIIWINIRVCLPFTFLLIILCCLVRLDGVHVSYYMNLLLSNLVQLIILIALPSDSFYYWRYLTPYIIFASCALASLCFRMMIALERYFSMACLLSNCITQTKGFVMVSVLVWMFCILFVPLFLIAFCQKTSYLIFALLPAPVFTICLFCSLKTNHVNSSVPDEEKCRNVRVQIVLVIQYFVTIFPTVIWFITSESCLVHDPQTLSSNVYVTFFHGYFMDLILFVFLCKGLMNKLCCCRIKNAAENDNSRSPE